MHHNQITTLFDYHWSTTERLLESAAQLPEEHYHAAHKFGHRSIHRLFFHILAADQGWRIGLETGKQQRGLDPVGYPDIAAIENLLREEREAWHVYLSRLDDPMVDEITLITLRKRTYKISLWRILIHLILHGMQHHSELSQALSNHNQSPGNIDFILYQV
ncbi:MAG: DinB family protein [Anaerolineales bacterium]|nr:DinB family protein [Anaerolineales bacterium]